MRFLRHCLLPVLLLSSLALCAQAPGAGVSPVGPALPAAIPPPAADSGAVLLFNGWYLPGYQPGAPAADTTGALLSLFRKRRYAGFLFAAPLIVGLSLALPLSSRDQYGQQQVASEAISPPVGSAILLGTVVGFIMHATRFNKSHLLAVDKAYATGQHVPRKYRSQLNATHFAEAAYLREAIAQQRARERLIAPSK